ncbi:hypothetical protein CMUS01_02842 [Colletotrichum musicola]|uniref:Uncharacterized protein n=1 Tax=Colletotrichum musicola TaxID=2175873 RepID=A0A8H6U6Q1_9PEZI|nr:hypothetical protein CMUS01_02842 [Colletotrichum musicola]
MSRYSNQERGSMFTLLALCILVMLHLATAQTATQTDSIPAIMPTLAGPSKPRTTPWEELCTTKGLIAPWMSYSFCTNSAMLAQLTRSDCSPYATRTLKDSDASGVLTDCHCPAFQTIGQECLWMVCPTEAANLYTRQLLQGVCPGVTATGNDSFPARTGTTTSPGGDGAAEETSKSKGPDDAAGVVAVPLVLSLVVSVAAMLSGLF